MTEPIYNLTYGQGMEGLANYSNTYAEFLLVPIFLIIIWSIGVYVLNKTDIKVGRNIAFVSAVCFILSLIAKTFTTFNDFFVFLFPIGILIGIIISYLE